VYANSNIIDFIAYHDMLAPFTASRVAKQRGLPTPDSNAVYPKTHLGNLQLFCDKNTFSIDNLTFEMEHVGGETPDNSTLWIPEYKAFFIADNYYTSFPNLYTLRGTQTRPALQYINALNLALSKKPEYLLMGHGEPLIGWENIEPALINYKDAIQYVHDETVKGINLGKSVYTLMNEIKLPEMYRKNMTESYGKVSWSVRGIYEGYIGWFDGNITNMYNAHPSIVYSDLLQLAGKENLIAKIKDYMAKGEFSEVMVLTDILLSANSNDKEAIDLRMQTLVQLSRNSSNWIEMNWLRSEHKSLNEIKKEIYKE
jgi:alkyl sulfatase BDS1-like metallo-beta-lactamase superfamily hydrolase